MNWFIKAVAIGILASGMAHADVTDLMLVDDTASTGDVLTNGMGRHLLRYSPLDILNKVNIDNLIPAWVLSLGGKKNAVRKRSH